eukprot:3655788-Rhodomonas_salina.1
MRCPVLTERIVLPGIEADHRRHRGEAAPPSARAGTETARRNQRRNGTISVQSVPEQRGLVLNCDLGTRYALPGTALLYTCLCAARCWARVQCYAVHRVRGPHSSSTHPTLAPARSHDPAPSTFCTSSSES